MSIGDGLKPSAGVVDAYRARVDRGEIAEDARQLMVAGLLDAVNADLSAKRLASKSSALGWLFAKRRDRKAPVKGLYLHGGVGRGKTMLMDQFFELCPARRKRRVHFNAFMADVHDRIARHRLAVKEGKAKGDDPIPPVASALAAEAWVLCFDEFSVTDIADAMILSRLFSALFEEGVVLVATSNVAPDDLYRDGLNRPLFEPFIAILKANCSVVELDSGEDYRMRKLSRLPVYLHPLDDETAERFEAAWAEYGDGAEEKAQRIELKGRAIEVERAVRDAARFTFAELCGRPLAARDYLAIADRFGTLFVDEIPLMDMAQRNEAKRFILLVDTLYDRKMRLVARAEAEPSALYRASSGAEAFEFERTVSRLIELQDASWPDNVK